uniref:Uncharacterized protein n=1 Tax=Oryza brachyantha TaxID=4533 RepID=J3MW32_ORYBR
MVDRVCCPCMHETDINFASVVWCEIFKLTWFSYVHDAHMHKICDMYEYDIGL